MIKLLLCKDFSGKLSATMNLLFFLSNRSVLSIFCNPDIKYLRTNIKRKYEGKFFRKSHYKISDEIFTINVRATYCLK